MLHKRLHCSEFPAVPPAYTALVMSAPVLPLFDRVRPESRAAHESIKESAYETRRRIMAYAIAKGPAGFIRDDLPRDWGTDPNHTAPRITELLKSGQLVETSRTRKTRAGCSARVLVDRQFAGVKPRG